MTAFNTESPDGYVLRILDAFLTVRGRAAAA